MVSDNGPAIKKALKHLTEKYGIDNVQILPYNKQANGKVERGHWDIHQSLYKAAAGDKLQWVEVLPEVLWSERITEKRSIATLPFRAVTGPVNILFYRWICTSSIGWLNHQRCCYHMRISLHTEQNSW